jgi:hypothetical protein
MMMIKPKTNSKTNSKTQRNGRNPRRNRYRKPSNNTIGAFVKAKTQVAPTRVDKDGFTKVNGRKPRRVRIMVNIQTPVHKQSSNPYDVLATSPPKKKTFALPAINKTPVKLNGAWARKVSFKNDSDSLMKPTPAETREYEKGSATDKFVSYPKEDDYLKLKRSKSAWCGKSRVSKSKEDAAKALAILQAQPKMPSYIGAWADAIDSDSDDEDEVVFDSQGRPSTDNSAW